jgi:hypothetical protein
MIPAINAVRSEDMEYFKALKCFAVSKTSDERFAIKGVKELVLAI